MSLLSSSQKRFTINKYSPKVGKASLSIQSRSPPEFFMPIDGQPDQKTTSDQEPTVAADPTEATAALTPEVTQVVNNPPPPRKTLLTPESRSRIVTGLSGNWGAGGLA